MTKRSKKVYQQSGQQGSTKDLLVRVYDEVLEAAAVLEFRLVKAKLQLLLRGISMDNEPLVGIGLIRLYDYLLDCCEKENAPEIVRVIAQLKQSVLTAK